MRVEEKRRMTRNTKMDLYVPYLHTGRIHPMKLNIHLRPVNHGHGMDRKIP
jgi:hypothetical protein